ncbi:MAG: sarcosine oxidase subunit gamma [Solirubrobacteraceae bacterium]
MTDDRRTAPLAGFADAFAAAASDAVRLVERPFLAQVGVRVFGARSGAPDPAGLSAAEAALGFPLPAEPNTVADAGGTDALWLGPDEWLVVSAPGSEAALEAELAEALAGLGSVVDLSANRTAVQVAGPRARDVLAKGCALDLHPRAFGMGRCAQTLLGRAQVVLEQLADEPLTYGLLVRNSFAAYVATWLLAAAEEFSSARASADRRQRSVRASSLNV